MVLGVEEDVRDQAHGGPGREDVGAAGDVLLQDVVLGGAADLARVRPLLLGDGDVEREEDGRRGVDGHRGGDLVQRDAIEERLHVAQGADGDAHLPHLALHHGIVGVVADLGGQVEGDGEAGLPLGEQVLVPLVRLLGGAEAGVLAHGPEPAAIHGGLDTPGVGIATGEA